MKVAQIMSIDPSSCSRDESLSSVAGKLWSADCGALPVVDGDGRVAGMITDRDIAIALGFSSRPASETTVGEVATGAVFSCRKGELLEAVLERMAARGVRRLPVVDENGRLLGMLSLNDLIARAPDLGARRILAALERIGRRTSPHRPEAAPAPFDAIAAATDDEAVRERILEYCGGVRGAPPTAWHLAALGGSQARYHPDGAPVAAELGSLSSLLSEGADVCRSLGDRESSLVHLDVDYSNPEDPAEPYRAPEPVFRRLEPVYEAVRAAFLRRGIHPLCLMTGRGYHFIAAIPQGTPLSEAVVSIGGLVPSLEARYRALGTPGALERGRAHEGIGRLLEHLAHEVIRGLRPDSPLPIALADVPPAPPGPFVCLDLSAYGDPLDERSVRCAFSSNQRSHALGIAPERPFVFTLPRNGMPLTELLEVRESPERVAALARLAPAPIPSVSGDSTSWVDEYLASPLAAFHRQYDLDPGSPAPSAWLESPSLPRCAEIPLDFPSPSLLKPVYLRTVAYVLWGLGCSPRFIGELVRSRYEADHGWGQTFSRYDPATRARFYVRLFCGALASGLEEPGDFSCDTQRQRGACPGLDCGHDLARFARKALSRGGPP
ncbi:MAG: CBS domain-containing protein [Acidobacteria bacterium]|nr:CBS domain-containing protein [Acidobacteriota bacterium]